MYLENKRIVVTGAGRGLGKAYAQAIAREGAAVVVNDVDASSASAVAEGICSEGGRARAVTASVADWDGAAQIVETCETAFGGIDGLINNAGLHIVGPFLDGDPESVRQLINVNTLGPIFMSMHAGRAMVRQSSRGVILNVTSGAASGLNLMSVYGASKGSVSALTWCLATELKDAGIRVNAISPSARTDMLDNTLRTRPSAVTWGPEVMAPLAIYLLSDLSMNVTGQIVRLWGTELELMRHHGRVRPGVKSSVWTVQALADTFAGELADQLQPYERDMFEFIGFLS